MGNDDMDSGGGDGMDNDDDDANHNIHRDDMAYLHPCVRPSRIQGLLMVVNRTFRSPLFFLFSL
jgi:hypothetical protein